MENVKEIYLSREERLSLWVEEYSKAILQTCLYMLPGHAQAEDAVQDTLIKAWRYLGSSKSKRINNERAWLLRIANNTCRDYLRGAECRYVGYQLQAENLPPKMLRIVPQNLELAFPVMDMTEKYRRIVLMHYFQGLTLFEIAELLEIPISTVKRRLRKAEEMLKARLAQA